MGDKIGGRIKVITLNRRTLIGSRYTWWTGNGRFINLSGKFLSAHIAHSGLIILWSGSMTVFEVSHFINRSEGRKVRFRWLSSEPL